MFGDSTEAGIIRLNKEVTSFTTSTIINVKKELDEIINYISVQISKNMRINDTRDGIIADIVQCKANATKNIENTTNLMKINSAKALALLKYRNKNTTIDIDTHH